MRYNPLAIISMRIEYEGGQQTAFTFRPSRLAHYRREVRNNPKIVFASYDENGIRVCYSRTKGWRTYRKNN